MKQLYYYYYIEHNEDTLSLLHVLHFHGSAVIPILWAQEGRYGLVSKEQVKNLWRRHNDLIKQQKGYTKNKPIDLVFYWSEVIKLDPVTVKLMRGISQ